MKLEMPAELCHPEAEQTGLLTKEKDSVTSSEHISKGY